MTNGAEDDDHKMAIVGELVYLAVHCNSKDCSCQISFEGLTSYQSTTTAIVKEVEFNSVELMTKCLRLNSQITQQQVFEYLAIVNGMSIGQLVRREGKKLLIVNSFYY